MGLYLCDVSDTPLGDVSTMSERDSASYKRKKVLFPDDAAEYQVDESERNLLEKLFIEDDKNSHAWYFKDDKTDCMNQPSTSSYLEQNLKVLFVFSSCCKSL